MSGVQRIRDLVAACLRSPDPEGDFGAIYALTRICNEGGGLQTLETIKRPLKNEDDQDGQLRMVNLLQQLVHNGDWNLRAILATEKWMTRLVDVAKSARSRLLRDRTLQMIVNWAALYSLDPSLSGFQNYGVWRIANSKRLHCPVPNITTAPAHPRARGFQPGAPLASSFSPQVSQPGGYSSPQLLRASSMSSSISSNRPMPGPYKQATSPGQAAYGVKTSVPPGWGSSSSPPPGFQMSGSHRGSGAPLGNVQMFVSDVDADVIAFNNALSMDHTQGQLPQMIRELEGDRAKINQYLNKDLSEEATMALLECSNRIDEAMECYAAITGAPLPSGATVSGPPRARDAAPGSPLPPPGLAGEQMTVMSNDGPDAMDGREVEGGDMALCSPTSSHSSVGEAPYVPPRDLSGNKTAVAMGLAPDAATSSANHELERLRQQLRHKEEQVQRLNAQVDDLRVENETLKAASGAAAAAGSDKAMSPQVQTALVAFAKRSKILIERTRQAQLDIAGFVETGRTFLQPSFADCILHMGTLARRPNNEKLIKKLQEDYLQERSLRKEYYNKIQELRGNIRVFCRVRPLSGTEQKEHNAIDVTSYPAQDEIVITDENSRVKQRKFEFDRVYQPNENQEAVFNDTAPLIESVIDGYNVTIFAYGQTGSGKTYTMEGPRDNPGVYTRALKRLFQIIEDKSETEKSEVHLSILEIYNEKIKDLLVDPSVVNRTAYEVKTGGETGNYISNLSSQHVTSLNEIDKWTEEAHKHRSSGKTSMNEHSSRSHMLLYFVVKTENVATGNKCYGKLSLIDLAGSERLKKSHASGQAATEATFINKSLSCLGDTIQALATGSKHVPYRNSKLTYLLQDSLSGQSKVLMFANTSPADYNTTETLSTLDFAMRARNTALGMAKKNN